MLRFRAGAGFLVGVGVRVGVGFRLGVRVRVGLRVGLRAGVGVAVGVRVGVRVEVVFALVSVYVGVHVVRVGLTQSELKEVCGAGEVALQVEVFYQNHDGGVDVARVLDQPLAVQVVAIIRYREPRGCEVPSQRVVQDSTAH